MLFIPAYRLVQDMLAAKRDLELPRMLRKLDNFDMLVIDDLGYLPLNFFTPPPSAARTRLVTRRWASSVSAGLISNGDSFQKSVQVRSGQA